MDITTSELKKLIDSKEKLFLIDVRGKNELEYGTIPTSNNIPLPELGEAFNLSEEDFKNKYGFNKPTKTEKIIFYCRTGVRADMAVEYLKQKGYENIFSYRGSVKEWSQIDDNVSMY
ncbi:rhodanese-like domain-containing protein [Nanoarchaeota archaeon]